MILRVAVPIWLALTLITVCGSFLHLDASSLWLDELFTAYFADPAQPTFAAFLNRASEDVHLPGYYAVVWGAGRLTGADVPVVARGVSAAGAALSLAVMYLALPAWVSRAARVFCCTFAATSLTYFIYGQEGRSYGLSWLLLTCLLALAMGIMNAARSENPIGWRAIAFAVVGVVAGLCHLYLVPVTGAIVAIMLCFGRSWTNRIVVAATGLAILATILMALAWLADKTVADVSNTWFQTALPFLWRQTNVGFDILQGSVPEQSLSTILVAAACVAVALMRMKRDVLTGVGPALADATFIFGSAALGIIFAVLVTVLYTPSYSFRFILVLAPVYWMSLGMLFEVILRSSARWLITGVLILVTVTFAMLSLRIVWRDIPGKQPWRETARFVEMLPACADAVLPVVTFAENYISESEPARFYGYYLKDGAARDWLSYPKTQLFDFPGTGQVADNVMQRINGTDPCPVLLWSVNHADLAALEGARASLLANFDLSDGTTIRLKTVKYPPPGLWMRILGGLPQEEGHFLLVERSS